MAELNRQQEVLAGLPVCNILVIAPAGCGKTEALAGRAAAVIGRGEIVLPRRVLALTFSNKARDNFAGRLAAAVGGSWRQHVTVHNFHGLAARVIRAHGNLLGIPKEVVFPEEPWRKRQLRDLGVDNYRDSLPFEAALHHAKFGRFDDDEVMARLEAAGDDAAIEFEARLRAEDRLDFDDLIRHGGRLLELEAVSCLYQAHFGMVLVDEVQDLSLLQYDMVRAVGGDRVTYAGDPAQGIYSFTGADAVGVFARIEALGPERVELNVSYRSARAVLTAVNTLAAEMGATQLECGAPEKWPDDGHVISLEREDTESEATAVLGLIERILREGPEVTVGVIGRRGKRVADIRRTADEAGVAFEDWSIPTHIPAIIALLHRGAADALREVGEGADAIDALERVCRELCDPADANTLDELAAACDALRDIVADGIAVSDAITSLRAADDPRAAVRPGLHLLTGHKGKGQEFDWVFVVGLEDGHVPDFRSTVGEAREEELRVLHVMVSRARYGVVLTHSRYTPTSYGAHPAKPSPWLELLRGVATRTDHE